MIRVAQTRSGPTGDCFEASLASILEIAVDDVPPGPDHNDDDAWAAYIDSIRVWLATWDWTLWGIGLAMPTPLSDLGDPPPGLWLAEVETSTPIYNHALVCRGGDVVWDPSPSRDDPVGLIGGRDPSIAAIWLVVPLDPAGLPRRPPSGARILGT